MPVRIGASHSVELLWFGGRRGADRRPLDYLANLNGASCFPRLALAYKHQTISTAYDKLLSEVCVRFGFCGTVVDGQPSHVDDFIPETGNVRAEVFADALFRAEGMDPADSAANKHRSSVCEAFERHLGAFEVDVRLLK